MPWTIFFFFFFPKALERYLEAVCAIAQVYFSNRISNRGSSPMTTTLNDISYIRFFKKLPVVIFPHVKKPRFIQDINRFILRWPWIIWVSLWHKAEKRNSKTTAWFWPPKIICKFPHRTCSLLATHQAEPGLFRMNKQYLAARYTNINLLWTNYF